MNAIPPRPQVIAAPGVYDGIPADAYHSPGITPEPALSSTGAKIILGETCAHYRHKVLLGNQPRKREFDIGNAGHLLCLEPDLFDASVVVIRGFTKDGRPSPGYQSADAREQRDAAHAAGKLPLLADEMDLVRAMRDAVWSHPTAKHAFVGGKAERSYFWRDREAGVWLKARLDYEPPHSRYIPDLKTSASANPAEWARSVWDYGYHVSAAHYLDGYAAIHGERPGRFFHVVVEKKPPHVVAVLELDRDALEWGRIQMRKAIRAFARCLDRDEWPGYDDGAIPVALPGFAIRDLEAQHAAGAFAEPDQPAFRHREHAAGFAAQSPV